MPAFQIFTVSSHSDSRGDLIPFEFDENFPIPVRRVYMVTAHDTTVIRGGHAHRSEKEVFVAAFGSVTAVVNDGSGDQEIVLDAKNKALFVDCYCWHEFKNFSPEAVLLCFSSTHYTSTEGYITDKDKFLKNKSQGDLDN